LITIEGLARRFAKRAVKHDVDDVVGDVVLYCLERLRSKAWIRPDNLPGYISQLVKARVVDGLRIQAVDEDNASDVELIGRSRGSAGPAPDCEWDEDRIAAFQADVMSTLPHRVREAYRLVRLQEASYEEAAAQMNVTVGALGQYIGRAHRAFRQRLQAIGLDVRTIDDWKKTGRRRKSATCKPKRTVASADRTNDLPLLRLHQPHWSEGSQERADRKPIWTIRSGDSTVDRRESAIR
jgi:RNA polymerase sigma factor (sigma-70 family)